MRVHQEECEFGSIKVWLRRYRREGRCLTCRIALVRGYDMTWCTPSARKSFAIVWVSRKRWGNPRGGGNHQRWEQPAYVTESDHRDHLLFTLAYSRFGWRLRDFP
jgi:hypothetical protein